MSNPVLDPVFVQESKSFEGRNHLIIKAIKLLEVIWGLPAEKEKNYNQIILITTLINSKFTKRGANNTEYTEQLQYKRLSRR